MHLLSLFCAAYSLARLVSEEYKNISDKSWTLFVFTRHSKFGDSA